MMSLLSRIKETVMLGLISVMMSATIVTVFPRVLSAQCGFGDCSLPGGACTNGVCEENPQDYQNSYYSSECDGAGGVCYHYICWWKDWDYNHTTCLDSWCYN